LRSERIDVEVLVVGGGPVGLSAAIQLARSGVRTHVVERRPTLSRHPKAMGVHPRTMELFRQWGVAGAVRAAGLPPERTLGFGWMTRVAGGHHLGAIMLSDDAERLAEYSNDSPEPICFAPQDLVEPILRDRLEEEPSASLELGAHATLVDQDDDGATLRIARGDGGEVVARAAYVVAADGARSGLREALGITESGDPPYGESVNVYFRSPALSRLTADRPYMLWWVINPNVQGTFWPVGRDARWIFNFEGDPAKPDSFFDAALCTRLLREGAGDPDLGVEILSVLRWQHERAVADTWRRGRVLIAGDAAHRFPPHGGFGMNSGIQDTANLCWKLAAVVRGAASDALLDSYEAERKPVAELNAEQCTLNTKKMEETGWLVREPAVLAAIERPEGAATRRRIAEAIPKQREQFWSQGQQFGFVYESGAVVDDGTEPERSTVADYRPTGHPGARAPHVWLRRLGGDRFSTIDLFAGRFTLLTGAKGSVWHAAAAGVSSRRALDLAVYSIGLEVMADRDFEALYGIEPDGAVLVRPDGHVALRARSQPSDPARFLDEGLQQIMSAAVPSGA
jgi:putative polyketide hydroxylase